MDRLRISQIGSRGIPGHRGGVERVIEAVAPRLVDMGHEVVVYCATWSEYRDPHFKGVKLRYLYSVKSKYSDTVVRSLLSTIRDIVSPSDVVHLHSTPSAPLALLARLAGKKVVVTVHGLEWQKKKWNAFGRMFLKLGEWAAVRLPHRTIVVSRELKRLLDQRYGTDVTYIPNGVEVRTRRKPERIRQYGIGMRDYILYLARLVPEKQCHVLIEAFRSLKNRMEMKLVVAGSTWHSAEYVASLHRLAGDDPSIIFMGAVDEDVLEELYSNCYAYVLPSEVEGMSLSLLDAMAFGACVVVSDIPANADVIGDSGVLFETGNWHDLAEKLCEILEDPSKAESFRSAGGRRISSAFHWNKIAQQWEEIYRGLY